MTMDVAIKAKWIEALRSGQYSQTKGRLRAADGFCCLGVLCELMDPSGWQNPEQIGSRSTIYTHRGYTGAPPSRLRMHKRIVRSPDGATRSPERRR